GGSLMLPPSHLTFCAKVGNETWPDKYHPVICHLIDVGQVARRMWDDVLRKQARSWVTNRLGLGDESAAGGWLGFGAGPHEIGRAVRCCQTQGKTAELRRRLGEDWFTSSPGPKCVMGEDQLATCRCVARTGNRYKKRHRPPRGRPMPVDNPGFITNCTF